MRMGHSSREHLFTSASDSCVLVTVVVAVGGGCSGTGGAAAAGGSALLWRGEWGCGEGRGQWK